MTEYAMYKGDEILYIGTLEEIAEKHGVKKQTIYHYTTDAYKKKIAKRNKAENFIEVFRIEDDW